MKLQKQRVAPFAFGCVLSLIFVLIYWHQRNAAKQQTIQPPQRVNHIFIKSDRKIAKNLPRLKSCKVPTLKANTPIPITLLLDRGWKINEEAPSWLTLFYSRNQATHVVAELNRTEFITQKAKLPSLTAGGNYRLQGTFYFCESNQNAICAIQSYDCPLIVRPEVIRQSLEIEISTNS